MSLPHPSRLVVHTSVSPPMYLHHKNAPMGMHVHPSHACTPCTCIYMPTHAYTCPTHTHRTYTFAISVHAWVSPDPILCIPPHSPCPSHANPHVHTHQPPSPHFFPCPQPHGLSLGSRVPAHHTGIWMHGPPPWTATEHTHPHAPVHPVLTLLPLLAAPPGAVSLWGWWGAVVC